MKKCFVISDNLEGKIVFNYLSKFYGKDIEIDTSSGYSIISIKDSFYKEAIEKYTEFVMQSCKSKNWWVDIDNSVIPIKIVPFMYAEIPEKFKTNSGKCNQYAKMIINAYVKNYERLIGQTIYYEETPEENNIRFFVFRKSNMAKKHNKSIKKINKYLNKKKNIFSKTIFYDIFGNNILQLC